MSTGSYDADAYRREPARIHAVYLPGGKMNFDKNEPQSVREARLAVERAEARSARKAASLDLQGAHIGAVIVAGALVLLGWYGKLMILGIVGGVFLLWFSAALAWAYADEDHGRHALQRAYSITFGWGNGL
ncbi:hypothetical protein ACFY84_34670 [Streptomyces sp. NPDC012438]|uniref:hypothetical protein n=1 Tax=Streptomyces sp. NPDC012438 TaxID=3364833 RepID=UPI0036E32F30